jgi:hypothetical protein
MITIEDVENKSTIELIIKVLKEEYPVEYKKILQMITEDEIRILYGTGKDKQVNEFVCSYHKEPIDNTLYFDCGCPISRYREDE